MKQNITYQQLVELTDKPSQAVLIHWVNSKGYRPLLSIGQMIEFLDEHGDFIYSKQIDGTTGKLCWTIRRRKTKQNYFMRKELADSLWRGVKSILEKGKI